MGIHKAREVVEMATKPDKFTLKPKQIRMAQKLADPGFTGTITELCDGIGVARTTFYDWMGQEKFREYLADLIDKFADSELATVWKALIKKCSAGDVQAMRLYFEVRERSAGGRASEDSGWFK